MTTWVNTAAEINADVLNQIMHPTLTTPADPTGILGATSLMLGLAVTYTPIRTGRIRIRVTGNITDDTTADLGTWILRYGTGTAPANQAASTGTAVTPSRTWTALTGMTSVPFAQNTQISGLTVGTTYWIDYAAAATGAGATVNMTQLAFLVEEI